MTPQPLYESVNPEEYLDLAKELSSSTQAAARRTAADRAYYAVFLVSRNILTDKDYVTPYGDERDHQYINEVLKRPDVLGSFGNEGLRLRRARNAATYDTREITNQTQRYARSLEWMLRTAEAVINRVQELQRRSAR